MRRFLAFFDKRTVVAFLTALTLLLVSCDVSGIGYEKYINEPFFARASGVVDGMEVEAEIYCDPSEHLTKEIYEKLIVNFSAPESLEGVTVTLLSSGGGIIRLGGIMPDESVFGGIAQPFLALCPKDDPSSVKREDNGDITVTYESGDSHLTYTFDGGFVPKTVKGVQKGREISLIISEFRRKEGK